MPKPIIEWLPLSQLTLIGCLNEGKLKVTGEGKFVLSHTPHFLDRADDGAPARGPVLPTRKLTEYPHPGHF
jgi:hypothetical protein